MPRILSSVALGFTIGFSSLAFAASDMSFESFVWKADKSFELRLNRGRLVFTGEPGSLNPRNPPVEAIQGAVTAKLHAYDEGLVTIVVTTASRDIGNVFVLNKRLELMNEVPIVGRKASLESELDRAVSGLQERKNLNPAKSLTSLVDCFNKSKCTTVTAFLNQVEWGNIEEVKPESINGPGNGRTIRTPKLPSKVVPLSVAQPNPSALPQPPMSNEMVAALTAKRKAAVEKRIAAAQLPPPIEVGPPPGSGNGKKKRDKAQTAETPIVPATTPDQAPTQTSADSQARAEVKTQVVKQEAAPAANDDDDRFSADTTLMSPDDISKPAPQRRAQVQAPSQAEWQQQPEIPGQSTAPIVPEKVKTAHTQKKKAPPSSRTLKTAPPAATPHQGNLFKQIFGGLF